MKSILSQEHDLLYILDTMDEPLVFVNHELRVKYMNTAAQRHFGIEGTVYIDRYFYNDFDFIKRSSENERKILEEVLETGRPQKGVIRRSIWNKVMSINAIPFFQDEAIKGILFTGKDVTGIIEIQNELDMAFTLMLPNSKVKHKLKNTVEYTGRYDPNTKMITITGIISEGGYRHVINCLRLLSSLYDKGITKVIGIDKDQLVQAFIFHDLGKSQPILSVGDVVDPKKVFEDSKLHAYRGAEIAKNFYHVDEDIVEIIRYHHHGEHELPETFP